VVRSGLSSGGIAFRARKDLFRGVRPGKGSIAAAGIVARARKRQLRYLSCEMMGSRSAELAERDSEQTRAQQHEAGRGQREEPVGDKIMISHHTPAALDTGPN
jgi:hypothetical protein